MSEDCTGKEPSADSSEESAASLATPKPADAPRQASAEARAEPAAAAAPADAAKDSPPSRVPAGLYSGLIGLAFWFVIFAIFVYPRLRKDDANLLLDVITAEPLAVGGAVIHRGKPVAGGIVQVTVMDRRAFRYLGSETLTVTPDGRFRTGLTRPLATGVANRMLTIQASFSGETVAADPKDRRALHGSETLYINFTPLFGTTSLWVVVGLSIPVLLLIFLFTGPLTKAKARMLFTISYGVALFSCGIPLTLTLWISRNPYVVEVMEQAPVGLFKGKAEGMEHPQWLVNIGGAVLPRLPLVERKTPGATPTPGATEVPPQGSESGEPATGTPAPAPVSADESYSPIEGGLAVPLFVLLLAMIGGGINMTRRVPEIQRDYDTFAITLGAAVRAPVALFSGAGERVHDTDAATVRKDLIETYMYFLSAPFLAIAVYYLLQVVAKSVAEPVLVVVAFATGLMSNTVVGSVIAFADMTLKKAQAAGAGSTPASTAAPPPAPPVSPRDPLGPLG